MTVAVVVLTCLVAATLWCLWTRSTLAAMATIAASAAWLPSNRDLEGHTVWVLDARHGVTVADLLALGCWLVATTVFVFRSAVSAAPANRQVRGLLSLVGCGLVLCLGALGAVASG